MDETHVYESQPLERGHARFLRISRRLATLPDGSQVPSCTHQYHSLDNPHFHYQALSYTWGDTTDPQPILLQGKIKYVTRNLREFLDRVVASRAKLNLNIPWWIDAVCINQLNNEEKSEQVAQMSKIYSKADHVVIWLGPQTESSELALKTVAKLADMSKAVSAAKQEELEFQLPDEAKSVFRIIDEPGVLDALESLFRRPWFSRAWVRQEVLLARRGSALVVCGDQVRPWEEFSDLRATLSRVRHSSVLREPRIVKAMSRIEGSMVALSVPNSTPFAFWILLEMIMPRAKASLPVDYVYSLLGVTEEWQRGGKLPISLNYGKTLDEVLVDVARFLYNETGSEALIHCHYVEGRPGPSWVPDWSSRIAIHPLGLAGPSDQNENNFCASGHGSDFNYHIDGYRLRLQASLNAVVTSVGKFWSVTAKANRSHNVCVWVREYEEFASQALGPDFLENDALWQTPIAGMARSRDRTRRLQRPTEEMRLAYQITSGLYHVVKDKKREHHEATIEYIQTLEKAISRREPVVFSNGRLGLAPRSTNAGDFLFLIQGLNTPAILREIAPGEYLFIGEAYVHGIMDGEAVEERPDFWKSVVLV